MPFFPRVTLRSVSQSLFMLLVLVLIAFPIKTAAADDDFSAVDRYVTNFMQQNRVPGLALAIVKGDQIVHLQGFSVADPSGRPVTAQTPFILGSTSKSFTALAVMQMVEAGKVDLDAPVTTYLPWFHLGNDGISGEITVRQLLNQTSGIPTMAGQATLYLTDSSPDALERQVRSLSQWTLAHPPGSAFLYANANYQTAGLIVQTVAGIPFESYVQEHIFNPLDMQHSYTDKLSAMANGLASGYHYWFGFPFPTGETAFPREHFPSGFYVSTAEDLAHALIAHLNNGLYQGTQVISPVGMAELHMPVLANYAMGWVVNNGVLSHNGSVGDFGSYLLVDRANQVGVAVLFNINNAIGASHIYIVGDNVAALLTGGSLAPTPGETGYILMAVGLLALLAGAMIWITWSYRRLRTESKAINQGPLSRRTALLFGLALVAEVAIAIILWQQMTTGLFNAWVYQPDFTLFIVADSVLLVGWGIVRSAIVVRRVFFYRS